MAKFGIELPTDIMKDFQKIYNNSDEIFGGMTKAGAEVVLRNVLQKCPDVIRPYAKLTRVYKTPSDDGINTKVIFTGYLPFKGNRQFFNVRGGNGKMYHNNKGIPADFLAIMYEYGRSTLPFPKKPFFRRSWNKGQIEKAMYDAQKKLSGGLLDE